MSNLAIHSAFLGKAITTDKECPPFCAGWWVSTIDNDYSDAPLTGTGLTPERALDRLQAKMIDAMEHFGDC